MNIDRVMFAFAGFMVFLSVGLGYYVYEGFFLLTAFVGFNMFQAAFTGFCPVVIFLKKIGFKSGKAF